MGCGRPGVLWGGGVRSPAGRAEGAGEGRGSPGGAGTGGGPGLAPRRSWWQSRECGRASGG